MSMSQESNQQIPSRGGAVRGEDERGGAPNNPTRVRQRTSNNQEPGAFHIRGIDGPADDGDDNRTIVIGGDTVVLQTMIRQSEEPIMEPFPASLAPEKGTDGEETRCCRHMTIYQRVLVGLFLFLCIAGVAIGLGLSGISPKDKATDATLPSSAPPVQNWTRWTAIGQPGDIVGGMGYDRLGHDVAVSGDGSVIAAVTFDATAFQSYILAFSITENSTTQLANQIEAPSGSIQFGKGVSLSYNGELLATGSFFDNAVYRRRRNWDPYGSRFGHGYKTVLSSDGSTAAVGLGSVQVYRYSEDNHAWSKKGREITGEDEDAVYFGMSVALSSNGNRLAAGLPWSGESVGRVRVFDLLEDDQQDWIQRGADIEGFGEDFDVFGISVSLSGDGSCVAMGAMQNYDYGTNSFTTSSRPGYAQVYCLDDNSDWVQRGQTLWGGTVMYGGGQHGSWFGFTVDLSADGRTLAVGAPVANLLADGDHLSGQVSIFRFEEGSNNKWIQVARLEEMGDGVYACGWSVSLSSNGDVAVTGCPFSAVGGLFESGAVLVFREVPCEEEENFLAAPDSQSPCRQHGL